MLCRRFKSIFNICYARHASCSATVLDFADIPSPKGQLPFIGSLLSVITTSGIGKLHEYLDKRHKELGPIFKDHVGPLNAVFVSDPDEMRNVFAQEGKYPVHINPDPWLVYNEKHNYTRGLFFMDGEEWLHYRRIMNKIFIKGDTSWIDESCNVAGDLLLERIISRNVENREYPSLEKDLYKWGVDTMVSILLGANTFRQSHEVIEPLSTKLAMTVHSVMEHTVKVMLYPARAAAKLNIPPWRRFENAVETTLTSANEIIDFVRTNFPNGNGLLHKMEEEKIERTQINRIVADLILGAGDTTTFALEWVLYSISKNKEIQPKIRQGDKTFLRNVLKETLRLYPVAPFLNRILPNDAIISGYRIPAGTYVLMTIYTSGRDEKYFKNPEQFLPDRWLRGDKHSTITMQRASLPFAVGLRSCIGKKIAETQITMALSKIVKHFNVELCNEKEMSMDLQMISKPAEELRLKFHKI